MSSLSSYTGRMTSLRQASAKFIPNETYSLNNGYQTGCESHVLPLSAKSGCRLHGRGSGAANMAETRIAGVTVRPQFCRRGAESRPPGTGRHGSQTIEKREFQECSRQLPKFRHNTAPLNLPLKISFTATQTAWVSVSRRLQFENSTMAERSSSVIFALCACTFALVAGCESLHEAGVPGMKRFVDVESRVQEEERQRTLYLTDRSPAAMQWLLHHRLRSGMTRVEIDHIFGEEGVREFGDRWLKTNGGYYRSGDKVYKWGPDSEGRSIYLVFREGVLINFDPNEFADPIAGRF